MHRFFYPDSLAIVGISGKPGNLGRGTLRNLRDFGFRGRIYGVGPEAGIVDGVSVFTSIADLPEAVDLAVMLTPARTAPRLIQECGERGIERAVIEAGGFAELSEVGKALQQELADTANRFGVRFIGPNCMGLICLESGLALPFADIGRPTFKSGSLTIVSQSSAVAVLISWLASIEGVGVAKYVSIGNKVDVDEVDLLPYFIEEDSQTKTIFLCLEGMNEGRALIETACRSAKPIVVMKTNISPETERAARSHTGSLASDDRVVEGALRQAGITRVKALREIDIAAKALSLPPLRGDNLGIVVCAGGLSVIAADQCHRNGFCLPSFPEDVLTELADYSRSKAINFGNPFDLGDIFDNSKVLSAFEKIIALPEVDGIAGAIFHFEDSPHPGPDTLTVLDRLADLSEQRRKPITLTLMTEPRLVPDFKQQSRLPLFTDIDDCFAALAMLRQRTRYQSRLADVEDRLVVDADAVHRTIAVSRNEGLKDIGPAAMDLLAAYGLSTAPLRFARTPEEAAGTAEDLGYPVVLKAVARELSHKSDVGGVELNLASGEMVVQAFGRIERNIGLKYLDAPFAGVVVQKMMAGGHEVIVGAKRDPSFGPVVMFGLGGVLTELYADVAFRLAPLTRLDAEEMIGEVKGSRLLRGFRGHPTADINAVIDAIRRVGRLICDHEEIGEIDVNPLKVFAEGEGAIAVDARVVLR